MAPKRAAQKAAPPPPPPADSSDETRSGSRSRSEESEDEEAIAESPVPAATPAPKHAPAPGDASEESGEEEEEDEEEEEEEEKEDQPARAAPKNPPPPPQQKKEDSDASGSDDEEDEEEEEEEEAPTLAAPPSVPKKQPPQPQKEQDSDTSGSDDEEEAPPPKPAANKETAALKPLAPAAAADEAKKPGGIQRIWSTDDELRILEALAAYQKQHSAFPQPEALIEALAGKLDNPAYGSKELLSKVKALKHRCVTLSKKGEVPSKEHDRRLLDLSKIVWEGGDKTITMSNNHGEKGFEEMCELYPYLAEEVKELEVARPGMCKREFGKMDHDKARAMDEKIKKQRVLQIKVEMRRGDLAKEVTKTLMDMVDG